MMNDENYTKMIIIAVSLTATNNERKKEIKIDRKLWFLQYVWLNVNNLTNRLLVFSIVVWIILFKNGDSNVSCK